MADTVRRYRWLRGVAGLKRDIVFVIACDVINVVCCSVAVRQLRIVWGASCGVLFGGGKQFRVVDAVGDDDNGEVELSADGY